jgi:hypothetical protein
MRGKLRLAGGVALASNYKVYRKRFQDVFKAFLITYYAIITQSIAYLLRILMKL